MAPKRKQKAVKVAEKCPEDCQIQEGSIELVDHYRVMHPKQNKNCKAKVTERPKRRKNIIDGSNKSNVSLRKSTRITSQRNLSTIIEETSDIQQPSQVPSLFKVPSIPVANKKRVPIQYQISQTNEPIESSSQLKMTIRTIYSSSIPSPSPIPFDITMTDQPDPMNENITSSMLSLNSTLDHSTADVDANANEVCGQQLLQETSPLQPSTDDDDQELIAEINQATLSTVLASTLNGKQSATSSERDVIVIDSDDESENNENVLPATSSTASNGEQNPSPSDVIDSDNIYRQQFSDEFLPTEVLSDDESDTIVIDASKIALMQMAISSTVSTITGEERVSSSDVDCIDIECDDELDEIQNNTDALNYTLCDIHNSYLHLTF